jgi:hypothetical protein
MEITLIAPRTTAEFEWFKRGLTLSQIASASRESFGVYFERALRMKT